MEPIYTGPATRKRYQSRAEEQIARCLDRHGITYRYEYPLALVDDGRVRIYYPDFQLPQYGLLVEYFGVVGNPHYDERTRHKLAVYRQAGMDGIFLTPEFFRGYWPDHLLRKIEDHLEGRFRDFHSHRQAQEENGSPAARYTATDQK